MQAPGQDQTNQVFSMLATQYSSGANISPKSSAGSGHPRMPASAQPHFQAHGCAVGLPQIAVSQAICGLARSSLDSTPHVPNLRKNAPACRDTTIDKSTNIRCDMGQATGFAENIKFTQQHFAMTHTETWKGPKGLTPGAAASRKTRFLPASSSIEIQKLYILLLLSKAISLAKRIRRI